nr:serine/arginine repetitive matrix protein 1-like [Penaeus vannamei]
MSTRQEEPNEFYEQEDAQWSPTRKAKGHDRKDAQRSTRPGRTPIYEPILRASTPKRESLRAQSQEVYVGQDARVLLAEAPKGGLRARRDAKRSTKPENGPRRGVYDAREGRPKSTSQEDAKRSTNPEEAQEVYEPEKDAQEEVYEPGRTPRSLRSHEKTPKRSTSWKTPERSRAREARPTSQRSPDEPEKSPKSLRAGEGRPRRGSTTRKVAQEKIYEPGRTPKRSTSPRRTPKRSTSQERTAQEESTSQKGASSLRTQSRPKRGLRAQKTPKRGLRAPEDAQRYEPKSAQKEGYSREGRPERKTSQKKVYEPGRTAEVYEPGRRPRGLRARKDAQVVYEPSKRSTSPEDVVSERGRPRQREVYEQKDAEGSEPGRSPRVYSRERTPEGLRARKDNKRSTSQKTPRGLRARKDAQRVYKKDAQEPSTSLVYKETPKRVYDEEPEDEPEESTSQKDAQGLRAKEGRPKRSTSQKVAQKEVYEHEKVAPEEVYEPEKDAQEVCEPEKDALEEVYEPEKDATSVHEPEEVVYDASNLSGN